jgi:hypothetical protein
VTLRSELQDIASELGLTREALYRTLAGLERAGMFFTAKVIVFSAANAVGEATTPTAKAAQARSFVIGESPFMSRGAGAQRSQSQVRQPQGS